MGKLISAVVSGVVGVALAAFTAYAVISANTAAPSKNPAHAASVDYGNR